MAKYRAVFGPMASCRDCGHPIQRVWRVPERYQIEEADTGLLHVCPEHLRPLPTLVICECNLTLSVLGDERRVWTTGEPHTCRGAVPPIKTPAPIRPTIDVLPSQVPVPLQLRGLVPL